MPSVTSARPRIWISPATLPALRAKAVPTNDRWNTLLSLSSGAASWDVGIIGPALCWLITRDPSFAAKAWSLMAESMKAGTGQVSPDSYYQTRNYLPASSIVYDWLHDWMSPAQRLLLQQDMEACTNAVWPETNPSRSTGWAIDSPGSNYYHGFLLTWMAGLSLYGDSPLAQGFIDNARAKYMTRVLPYLTHEAQGGLWAEGMGYGTVSTMEMLQYLLANLSATGEDLIRPNPWFTDAVSAMIHMTNPTGTEMAPWGDLGAGPIADKHRMVMMMLSPYDIRCKPWLDSIQLKRVIQRLNAWASFLWYPSMPLPAGEVE